MLRISEWSQWGYEKIETLRLETFKNYSTYSEQHFLDSYIKTYFVSVGDSVLKVRLGKDLSIFTSSEVFLQLAPTL